MRLPSLLLTAALLAAPLSPATAAPAPGQGPGGVGDAVVIAVIDSGFTPYHWDYLAAKMPQAADRDRGNDLPLTKAPHTWLPGFPKPSTFKSYRPLKLHLDAKDPDANPVDLDGEDTEAWDSVEASDADEVHYNWIPGTKVVGALSFGAGKIHANTSAHGTGTTSVSVGNLHGTCPECLLVFIQYSNAATGEAAINWAMRQPWIDAISNSYGFTVANAGRLRVYNGSDTVLQQQASERGQTILFSAGNGNDGGYATPNTTLQSSQEGPDWIITVGGTSPKGKPYYGTGKPADVAGIGASYPSAYTATTVGGTGRSGFGGTSNATPTVAGTYGRALWVARRAMTGASRVQDQGVVARGAYRCAAKRRDCELGDGKLTVTELRRRLLESAVSTGTGYTDPQDATELPNLGDSRYAGEGHGTYFARLRGSKVWLDEFARVSGPLLGTAAAPKRPADEKDWFVVDSWCRQHIWGEWNGGDWRGGMTLPAPSPGAPARNAYHQACAQMRPPPR